MIQIRRFTVLLGLLITCIGCSENVKMGGKVTFSDDDKPLTTGIVCFQRPGFMARGQLQSDGIYEIGSTSEKNGLPPGSYQVYVSGASDSIPDEKTGIISLQPLIEDKFTNIETSGLNFEVTKKTRRFDFKVDRYKQTLRK